MKTKQKNLKKHIKKRILETTKTTHKIFIMFINIQKGCHTNPPQSPIKKP
jgi:hypothetical protein